jgi:hypothetical protein
MTVSQRKIQRVDYLFVCNNDVLTNSLRAVLGFIYIG